MRTLTLAAGLASALALSAAPAFAHDFHGHRHVVVKSFGHTHYHTPSHVHVYKAPTHYAPSYIAPSYEPKVVYVAPPTYVVKKVFHHGHGHGYGH